LAGLAYALPLALLLREAPARRPAEYSQRIGTLDNLRFLLTSGPFLLLVACFTLPALAAWVVRDWMPAILKQQFGIGQGQAGVSASLYWNIAALGGVMLGGWMADRWSRITPRGRTFAGAIGIALLVPALFGVGNADSLLVAVLFLVLFGIGWGIFDCNNMPILCQIAPPDARATGYGIMNLVSISCGGIADWGFGAMRDARVPLNVTFSAFAALACVAVILMLCIQPRPEPREPA
jgi:sugar phosphate permease